MACNKTLNPLVVPNRLLAGTSPGVLLRETQREISDFIGGLSIAMLDYRRVTEENHSRARIGSFRQPSCSDWWFTLLITA